MSKDERAYFLNNNDIKFMMKNIRYNTLTSRIFNTEYLFSNKYKFQSFKL